MIYNSREVWRAVCSRQLADSIGPTTCVKFAAPKAHRTAVRLCTSPLTGSPRVDVDKVGVRIITHTAGA